MSDYQDNNAESPKAWHYAAFGGSPKGPVTEIELSSLHKAGKINDATLIWREGQAEWLSYGTLFPSLLPPVPGAPAIQGYSSLAEIHTRFGAYLIDQLAAIVVMLPGAFFLITPNGESVGGESLRAALWLIGIGLLIYTLVQVTMISGDGQSIGKWALKIKIVGIQAEENPGVVRAYLLRSFSIQMIAIISIMFSSMLLLDSSILGFFGMAILVLDNLFIFSPSRRCLHDIVAGTKVVKVDK